MVFIMEKSFGKDIFHILESKGKSYYYLLKSYFSQPFFILCSVFLLTMIIYPLIDFVNLSIHLYPVYIANAQYGSSYVNQGTGVADLNLFYQLGYGVLHGSFFLVSTGNWDGGLLAPFFYAIPVFFSLELNLDAGYCFRTFYLLLLLGSGLVLYRIAEYSLSPRSSLFITLSYVYNPFILIEAIWVGNEEIIATFLLLLIVYFLQQQRFELALISTLFASFYKYYALLFLPLVIIAIPENRARILTIIILSILFVSSFLLVSYFSPEYIAIVQSHFLSNFPVNGKGLIAFLVTWDHLNISSTIGMLYFGCLFLLLSFLILFLSHYSDHERFGIVILVFFLCYPEFYLGYLLIPFVFLQFFFFKHRLLWISYILFIIPANLSQLAFTDEVSLYSTFHLTPTNVLIMFGVVNLLIMYVIMVLWILIYFFDKKYSFLND